MGQCSTGHQTSREGIGHSERNPLQNVINAPRRVCRSASHADRRHLRARRTTMSPRCDTEGGLVRGRAWARRVFGRPALRVSTALQRPVIETLSIQGQATRDVVNQQGDATREGATREGLATRRADADQAQATRDVVDVQSQATRDVVSSRADQIVDSLASTRVDLRQTIGQGLAESSLRMQESIGYIGHELRIIRDLLACRPDSDGLVSVEYPFIFRSLGALEYGSAVLIFGHPNGSFHSDVAALGYDVYVAASGGSAARFLASSIVGQPPDPMSDELTPFDCFIWRASMDELSSRDGTDGILKSRAASIGRRVRRSGLLIATITVGRAPGRSTVDVEGRIRSSLAGWVVDSIRYVAITGRHVASTSDPAATNDGDSMALVVASRA